MRALRIGRLEWRMAARDRGVRWVFAATLGLACFAGFNGWRWRHFQAETVREIDREASEREAAYVADTRRFLAGTLDPSFDPPNEPYNVYGWLPRYATWEPGPLAALSVGQSDLWAYYGVFSGVTSNQLFHAEEVQNPFVLALGRFDLAFFLVVVLPILAFALCFDLRARDREAAREGLLLAQAGSLSWLAALRAALRFAWLAAAMGVAVGAVLAATGALSSPAAAVRLGWVLLLVTLYLAFWFALGFAVNAFDGSSTRNAVLLLALWGAWVLLAPAAVDALARARHPVPTEPLRVVEERRMLQRISEQTAVERLAAQEPALAARGSATLPAEARWVARFELVRDTTAHRRSKERAVILQRHALAERLAFLSPALVLHGALERIAGSSVRDVLRFAEHYERYTQESARAARGHVFRGRPFTAEEIQALPDFSFRTTAFERFGGRLWLEAAALVAGSALLLVIGFHRGRRPA